MLTLCMIVKDEERRLVGCLDSVQALVNEIVVVDTGSTDSTAAIARERGAQVIPFDFQRVDFAGARNHALAQATGDWIIVLDADETLDRQSIRILQTLTASEGRAAFFFERLNHAQAAVTSDYVVRLFPNRPEFCYRGRVHETVHAPGAEFLKSGVRIHHQFADDPEARRRKNHWYIEVLKEEIAENPTDSSRLDFLAAEYHQLGQYCEASRIMEHIAVLRPQDAQAHLFAGTYHLLYESDFVRARADFQRALKLKANYPEAESFLRLLAEKEAAASQINVCAPAETLPSRAGQTCDEMDRSSTA